MQLKSIKNHIPLRKFQQKCITYIIKTPFLRLKSIKHHIPLRKIQQTSMKHIIKTHYLS